MSAFSYDGKRRINFVPDESPHAWIQWKGTDVCMDVRCPCGTSWHVDAWFCYHIKCPGCGKVYECNPYIELRECQPGEDTEPTVEVDP